jgi:AraC-like DNA-binding protein
MVNREILEVLVRGAAAGAFLGLAIAVGRAGASSARVTGVLFCLAAASHTVAQFPPLYAALGWAEPVVWALSESGAGLFWAFATDLFGDRERSVLTRFLPAGVLLALSVSTHMSPLPLAGVESAEVLGRSTVALSPFAALVLLTLSLASIAAFLRADPALFGIARSSVPEPKTSIPVQDQPLLARLNEVLERDEVWRREALGIRDLAALVGVPEHRLRKLINQILGYRNFAAFLNERRIAAARHALADPFEIVSGMSKLDETY